MASKFVEAELKSTRVVPFSGKKEDWDMWQIKHMGRASFRGTHGTLMGTEAVPVVTAGVAPTSDEEEIIELNTIAYNDLLQSVSEAISFNLVQTGVTVELPDGSAVQAWKNPVQQIFTKYSCRENPFEEGAPTAQTREFFRGSRCMADKARAYLDATDQIQVSCE